MAKVIVYSKANCPYCTWAKLLLEAKHIAFEEVRVDLDPVKLEEMIKLSERRTTPQIIINEQAIGGYDDLSRLAKSGELEILVGQK